MLESWDKMSAEEQARRKNEQVKEGFVQAAKEIILREGVAAVSARKIAHRVAMIYRGRIIWVGPRDRLYDSGNPYVDQFVQGNADGPIR